MGLIAGIALIAGIDLCIKEEIEARDSSEFPKELKGGKIILHKSHNEGFPFQVLKNHPNLVKIIPVMVISGLTGIFCFLIPKKGYWIEKFSLMLTLGGAVSNLYDRFTRNYVVDYFSINVKKLNKIIFNLGDISIFAGSFLLVFSQAVSDIVQLAKRAAKKKK